jgi:hypothetical protein
MEEEEVTEFRFKKSLKRHGVVALRTRTVAVAVLVVAYTG